MRKYRSLLGRAAAAFAAVTLAFGAGPSAAQDMTPAERELYKAAQTERELTWYIGQYTTEVAEAIGQAFSQRYPGVKVNVIRSTGQVIYSRLTQDLRSGVAQCDVFGATDVSHLLTLKANNQLLKYRPENLDHITKQFQNYDPDGFIYVTFADPIILIYNNKLVSEADAPKAWTDLLNPKFKGKLATGHPGFSGTMGAWLVLMEKLHGNDFIKKLATQDPLISRSLADPIFAMAKGERSVGFSVVSITLAQKASGAPLSINYPTDGAMLVPLTTAILANTTKPNAAKLFVNYLMSAPHFQHIANRFQYMPLRSDVSAPADFKPFDQFKIAPLRDEEIAKRVPALTEQWRDLFGG